MQHAPRAVSRARTVKPDLAMSIVPPAIIQLATRSAATLTALLVISGCFSAPPSYSERTQWPQKDVALISIRLEEKLSATEYLEIVEREQAEFLARRRGSIVPVYQVRFQFLLTGESSPLAEVTIVSGRDESSGEILFSAPSVIIY